MYSTPETEEISQHIRRYIKSVLDEGWIPANSDPFDTKTITEFKKIYEGVIGLQPVNEKQQMLKSNMMADLNRLSDFMQVRIYQSRQETQHLLYIAVVGLMIIMVLFSVYPPDRVTLFFLFLYNGFIASIIYFTVMMSQPLIGPMQVKPVPFMILQETIDSRMQ